MGEAMGWFAGLFKKNSATSGEVRQNPDSVAKMAIEAARCVGAKSPREAAEITAGRKLSDQEWERFKGSWERNW
jgi:hypothetical protein